VFATAREKARQTACSSNLRQIGIAFAQYEQDYDELIPCGLPGYSAGAGWGSQMYPYIKSINVFACPDDTTTPAPFVSYGVNENMIVTGKSIVKFTSPAKTVELFEVTGNSNSDPSVPNSNKSPTGYGWSGNAYDPSGSNSLGGSGSCSALETTHLRYVTGKFYNRSMINKSCFDADSRHSDGANYLMADSHVKWLKGSQVSTGVAQYGTTWQVSSTDYQDKPSVNVWGWGTPAGTEATFDSAGKVMPAATFSTY
jgi:prepilin-type processing-associated H-X9-DG protein